LVYGELKAMAAQHMADERDDHTLQATALVHEAYMRLIGEEPLAWSNRGHFFFAAARAMRRILIEHARSRLAQKRGGGRGRLPLNVADMSIQDDPHTILAVDEAISRLEDMDERAARIVRLRFYAGLSNGDVAQALEMPERSVRREWSYARIRLFRMLGGEASG
jgi:RNA polymerase sigma factor (TIGR02999 family)